MKNGVADEQRPRMTRPKVLVVADTRTWAWARKAAAYQRWLNPEFDITIAYSTEGLPDPQAYALVHCFEVLQLGILSHIPPPVRTFKVVAGLTAHVWEVWGEARMRGWAAQCDAMHGNSLLLVEELRPFHPRVMYCPNGVDPDTFRRTEPYPAVVTFGHVGKPNPRKGGHLIIEAARLAGVPLLVNQRTSKLALPQSAMAAWYQGVTVQVTASNSDGTPCPMLEAAATGCALLSTHIGNMREFVRPGENGILTKHTLPRVPGPSASPDTLTSKQAGEILGGELLLRDELIEHMRTLNDAKEFTEAMGRAARETILREWTWEMQTRHVAAMWTEVLG